MATLREAVERICVSFSETGEQGKQIVRIIDALFNFSMEEFDLDTEAVLMKKAMARNLAEKFCNGNDAIMFVLYSLRDFASQELSDLDIDQYLKNKRSMPANAKRFLQAIFMENFVYIC